MRFFVNGMTWEPTLSGPSPTRREAIAALEQIAPQAQNGFYCRAALAAFSVADYRQAVACAELAQ